MVIKALKLRYNDAKIVIPIFYKGLGDIDYIFIKLRINYGTNVVKLLTPNKIPVSTGSILPNSADTISLVSLHIIS